MAVSKQATRGSSLAHPSSLPLLAIIRPPPLPKPSVAPPAPARQVMCLPSPCCSTPPRLPSC
jgi:hypothetical protein